MLGFRSPPPLPLRISSSKSKPFLPILRQKNPNLSPISVTLKKSQSRIAKQFQIYAENGNSKNDGPPPPPLGNGDNGANGEDEKVKNGRPRLNLKWMDLLLDPDPDNLVAVGLTGLLSWASVQLRAEAFENESAALNLTATEPVKPFKLCYRADDVRSTYVGPGFPTIDLGRKLSMLFGGLLFCAGALINCFAQAVWMLIAGRQSFLLMLSEVFVIDSSFQRLASSEVISVQN